MFVNLISKCAILLGIASRRVAVHCVSVVVASTASIPMTALAQDSGWRHTLSPYLMAASLDGSSGVGPLDVNVDLGPSDIFSNLDFGAMLAYRGETENWAVMADFIYMKLGASDTSQNGLVYGRINLDQTIFQADVARRLSDHWEVTFGARYWDVETALLLRGQGPVGTEIRADTGESWIDPVIGVRFDYPFNPQWALLGKADVGGFGIGSDSTWQTSLGLRWQFSDNMSTALIFRYIDVDYESGSGASRFALDVAEYGPGLGLSFSF